MGTNYYLVRECCEHCGRGVDRLHIGKSSAGWMFSLNTHPDEGINSLDDWKAQWSQPRTRIINEYGDPISPEHMLNNITKRRWDGPGGLRRHALDMYCIGHGAETYDLMRGEFS